MAVLVDTDRPYLRAGPASEGRASTQVSRDRPQGCRGPAGRGPASAAARFSSRWASDEVPGISSTVGARASSQASATWAGVAPEAAGRLQHGRGVEHRVVGDEGRAEGEERHVGHPVRHGRRRKRLVAAVGQVVGVLDAGHLDLGTGRPVLVQGDVAQADPADEPLVTQRRHGRQLVGEGHVAVRMAAEVDHRDLLEAQGRPGWPPPRPAAPRGAGRRASGPRRRGPPPPWTPAPGPRDRGGGPARISSLATSGP